MKESTNPGSRLTHQQRLQLELLHSVLDDDAATYPWNPQDPAAIAYLDRLQAELPSGDLSEDEFDSKWQQVSQIAAQLWETPEPLVAALAQKFGARIPTHVLNQLAASAQAASQSGRALIDQLVESAQSVLESWEADDLQVMARPLAMAMRGSGQEEILEVTLRSIRQVDWEDLSEVEQARLSLVAARYALGEIAED